MSEEKNSSTTESRKEIPEFAITKDFLELAFEKKVDFFKTKLGTNPGDNYMSVIYSVEVVFKENLKTSSHYLIKCYPNHPSRREFLDESDVFAKELFVYQRFMEELKQIVIDSGADKSIAGIAVPPFHGGNVMKEKSVKFTKEPWSKENFIIMTDLRTIGYKMADRIKGLDLDHAKVVLKEMAKLHAASWAYKQKNNLRLLSSKYPNLENNVYANENSIKDFIPMLNKISENTMNMVKEKLGNDHPAYLSVEKLLKSDTIFLMSKYLEKEGVDEDYIEGCLRVQLKNDDSFTKDAWLVGAHGDCWVNNMLFKYESQDETKPVHVMFVDFQLYQESCPTLDLTYFFFTSVRAPVRIANRNVLLRTYYDTFLQSCEALKVDRLPGFTFENLDRRFRRAEVYGFIISMELLTFIWKPKDEAADLDKPGENANINYVFSAVVDGSENNTQLREETVATVLDLYERGIL